MNTSSTIFFPPEWEIQDAILIAWPHANTDWAYMLDEVRDCYINIANAILEFEDLVVIADDLELAKSDLNHLSDKPYKIHYYQIPTNDTWARDFGALTVYKNGIPHSLDFKFNAWGMKFAADKDNLINQKLQSQKLFNTQLENHQDFVLEGGSIESDGNRTILTTTKCLLSPNRNGALRQEEIECYLKKSFGASNIIWLNFGEMPGDDTDGHIDTIARFAPNNTIIYNAYSQDNKASQEQIVELEKMKVELKKCHNADGKSYSFLELPVPDPIFDVDDLQLPATYANFLVVNGAVLVPIYNQPKNDSLAIDVIKEAFPERKIVGIDCNALIKQHGSLHCVTMQFPKNSLNL